MLNVKREQRKYKFAQAEYRIPRYTMMQKVSKILAMRIQEFMDRILSEDVHCHDDNHKHEEVRESSMLFKECSKGPKTWTVDIPTAGLANLMPLFNFSSKTVKQPWENLDKPVKSAEILKFISVILNTFQFSGEVCLLSLIFIERLLKKGKVQLLTINWRPIVYTAILIAAKYWEDI